jgi:amino acid adenylation domain-containing protein
MPANPIIQCLIDLPPAQRRRELIAATAGRLSYGDVRDGMLAYAGWLTGAEGIQPGDRVAICLPKSLETVQLVYAILAAGAAYVPLQYQGPPARLSRILTSIRPALFITTRQMAAMMRAAGAATLAAVRVIEVEDGEAGLAGLIRGVPPRRNIADVPPEGLAVVFFTSGSTGEPKGVMWSQRNMQAAIMSSRLNQQVTPDDRFIGVSGLHYSSSEIFFPVTAGARVYLCSDRETSADHIAAAMEREATTIWAATSTALRLLVEGGDLPARDLRALRLVVFFGERMSVAALRAAMEALPHAEFRNLYGATEAFGMAEHKLVRPPAADTAMLPVGRPRPEYAMSLRDEDGLEVAPGRTGEICVTGPAVTIGYWNDPALTATKRLPGVPDSYRTGDLARRDGDGTIWLVGRKDHQVKLRGHRFDLSEIEAVARGVPGVQEAVALAPGADQEKGELLLAVLVVGATEEKESVERRLKRICRERLPRFAWPGRIATCADFPLLSSGKIDRRALEAMIFRS